MREQTDAINAAKGAANDPHHRGGSPSVTFLPASHVCARYGVHTISLWRWLQNEALGFPHPIRINGRRFWELAKLEAWEASRSEGGASNA